MVDPARTSDPRAAGIEYVLRHVEERGVRLVQLWFTDVLGFLKSFVITPAELENAFEEGLTFDGSAIDGFSRHIESDMLAFPDASTFELLPWHAGGTDPVGRMFCNIANLDESPFAGDPRQVLRSNLLKARAAGLEFFASSDLEWFYFADADTTRPPKPLDHASFFDLSVADAASDLRRAHGSATSRRSEYRCGTHITRRRRASRRSTCATRTR